MNKEPKVVFPKLPKRDSLDPANLMYIPFPNTIDKGIYVTVSDFAKILKANKHNPKAIEYLADML